MYSRYNALGFGMELQGRTSDRNHDSVFAVIGWPTFRNALHLSEYTHRSSSQSLTIKDILKKYCGNICSYVCIYNNGLRTHGANIKQSNGIRKKDASVHGSRRK